MNPITTFLPHSADASRPPAQPLLAPTGNATVDAVADVINKTAEPFQTAPPPEQGTVGAISHDVNAVLGVVGAPFAMLDAGFAAATAGLAAMMPGLPAATLTAPHVGMPHGHAHPPSLIPPAPPVPLPSIGMVAAAGCVSVIIGGLPAARASDVGPAPTCGSFGPIFEVYTGSSNTFIGGSRAARLTDITRHCNPASALGVFGKAMGAVGVAASALGAAASASGGSAAAAAVQAAQAAADAVALAMAAFLGKDPGIPPAMGALMFGNPTVLIGGFPMPDILDLLGGIAGAAKKASALVKKAGRKKGKAAAKQKPQKCNDPGEPVSIVTGEVYNDWTDATIDPESEWRWGRHYRSGWADDVGSMGRGFRHCFEKRLELKRRRAIFIDHDGVEVEFPRRDGEAYGGMAFGYALSQLDPVNFSLQTPGGGPAYRFHRKDAHSARARLIEVRSATSSPVWLDYDRKGRLTRLWRGTLGSALYVLLRYDAQDRIIAVERQRDGERSVSLARYGYDEQQCMTTFRNARGAEDRYVYRSGRMTRAEDPRGYGFNWRYDHLDRCVSSRGDDALLGVTIAYEVGRRMVTQADGGVWIYVVDDDGIITHIHDPGGGCKQYRRRQDGLIGEQVDATGQVFRWLYDENDHHVGRLDPWGNVVPPENELPYPASGRELVAPANARAMLVGSEDTSARINAPRPDLDLMELPEALRSEAAAVLTGAQARPAPPMRKYDALGATITTRDVTGAEERYEYSPQGEKITIIDPDGAVTRREFDSWNLLMRSVDPNGAAKRYAYDHRREITSITDPRGHVVRYERDHCGRVSQIFNAEQPEERYERDEAGRVTATYDGEGQKLLEYTYGPHGLCELRTQANGTFHRYAYDQRGNICEASSGDSEVRLAYDTNRRVVRDERDGRGIVHRWADGDSRATTVLDRFVTRYVTEPGGTTKITTSDGGEHRVTMFPGGCVERVHPRGLREISHFDAKGRCSGRYVWIEGQEQGAAWYARYTYSPAGELKSIEDRVRGTIRLTYDAAHRLTGVHSEHQPATTIRHDPSGNIVQNRFYPWLRANARNQLVDAPGESFAYDRRYHLSEHLRAGVVTRYHYDDVDRLVRVTWDDGRPEWTAGYDGLGRRSWKEQDGRRTDFYWDGSRLAAELSPNGILRVYVYPTADGLVPMMFIDYAGADAGPASGTIYYVFCDQVGLPSHVCDADGALVWWARQIDPFGAIDVDPSHRTRYALRFPGHYHDDELGLHYNRFRYYDPRLGRYLQSDPMGQAGGVHVYAYPANPLVRVDVFGLHDDDPATPPHSTDGAGPKDKSPEESELRQATKAKADALQEKKGKERPTVAAGMQTPDGNIRTEGSHKGPREGYTGLDGAPKTKAAYDKAADEVVKPADWDDSVHGPWPESHQSGKCGEAKNIAAHERDAGELPPPGTKHDAVSVKGKDATTSGHGEPKPACPYCSHVQDQLGHSSDSGQSPYDTKDSS